MSRVGEFHGCRIEWVDEPYQQYSVGGPNRRCYRVIGQGQNVVEIEEMDAEMFARAILADIVKRDRERVVWTEIEAIKKKHGM